MERIHYSRTRLAELLGITEARVVELDKKRGAEVRSYTPADLSAYRQALAAHPPRKPLRRQLFLNFKGGTGKTSLSTAYAYRQAERGHRVLLVDLDSQGHAAKCLGYDAEEFELTLFDTLIKKTPLQKIIRRCPLEELDLCPSNLTMARVDLALMPLNGREFRLRQAFESLDTEYEFIVMDAPPSFGLLNLNALMATDDLFIPVLADFLSFHGLKLLFETISDLEQDLELHLGRIFVVLNQFNPSTKIARQARDALEGHYADYLLKAVIRQCTKFAQASSEGLPISAFDPQSKAATDIEAMIAEVTFKEQTS